MRIGVDFDNTIVCYDGLFHRVALEQGLIPAALPADKGSVRDHLRRIGREDAWTEMQGTVYGARMLEAAAFPGVLDFFRRAVRSTFDICIVSHKTRHPYLGPKYDLHEAAAGWLERNGFFDADGIGMRRGRVFFELTLPEKLRAHRRGGLHALHRRPAGIAGGAGVPEGGVAHPFRPDGFPRGGGRRAAGTVVAGNRGGVAGGMMTTSTLSDERLEGATRLLHRPGSPAPCR